MSPCQSTATFPRAAKQLETRPTTWSRLALLTASGLFTVALFLLDAQALQVQQLSVSTELLFYMCGLLSTLVYVGYISKGRRRSCSAQETDAKASVVESVVAFLRKVRTSGAWLRQQLQRPNGEAPRPREERPPIPFWLLATSHLILISMSIMLFCASFVLPSEAAVEAGEAFLDAPPRCEQDMQFLSRSVRQWSWLIAAFLLSSGLCVVHPLQSGLVAGF
eukprot:TRINITY_DN90922_c0_g1_i1.p1 TRINITY_DN90922_c0_g1~~TRINITY_DN90922_c0_g1_i1.p1  ORF type:complete len:221 (-),score=42.18 TRINITY_DN90922_c0_g1_i1:91-753(-)